VSLATQLLLATAVLHRFAALQTAVAINLMAVSFGAAALASLGAIAALAQVWRFGSKGSGAAALTLIFGGALLMIPVYYLPVLMRGGGPGFDAATTASDPPGFVALAKVRAASGLPPERATVSTIGPDGALEPLITPRSPGDVFDLSNELVRQLDLNIVAEQAPGFGEADGSLEVTDKTWVLGLVDDVSIRIGARDGQTRVDVRSAARYPRLDLGRNAERVQVIVRKLRAAIDSSVPSDPALASDAPADLAPAAVKPGGGTAGAATVLRRKKGAPAQPGAPSGRAPIAGPR